MSLIEFWEGLTVDIDLKQLELSSVSVKGKFYHNPCRFIEIFGNFCEHPTKSNKTLIFSEKEIIKKFLPNIPSVKLELGDGIYHPPFIWSDCSPCSLSVNFTYNTNAFYRIFSNLAEDDIISTSLIDSLIDKACLLLANIYKSNNHLIMKNINNNINMFIISKIIEVLLGRHVYNSERQEVKLTDKALELALNMISEHASLRTKEQMALALGKGIAFVEKQSQYMIIPKAASLNIMETTYAYTEGRIAIDDRQKLIDRVYDSNEKGVDITMCAILDDTAESVDDLLWIQNLIVNYSHFKVNLLVNTAQISINFTSHMLQRIFKSPYFKELHEIRGKQLFITETYCPLISFQLNLLTQNAKKAIKEADFVFVKGLNFFETCQILEKDVFHAFVVYGPVSRLYTGLEDYDGVFVYLPTSYTGYIHNVDRSKISTLKSIWSLLKDQLRNS